MPVVRTFWVWKLFHQMPVIGKAGRGHDRGSLGSNLRLVFGGSLISEGLGKLSLRFEASQRGFGVGLGRSVAHGGAEGSDGTDVWLVPRPSVMLRSRAVPRPGASEELRANPGQSDAGV